MSNDELREKFKTLMLATNEYCLANFKIHEPSGKYYDWCLQAKWEGFLLGYEIGTTDQAEIKPKPQEPEWRPMSEAPKGFKTIKVKYAKTGEEFFSFFYREGWSCSKSQHPAANTFLFLDSQLIGWRPL
jgi:hypothetical protein